VRDVGDVLADGEQIGVADEHMARLVLVAAPVLGEFQAGQGLFGARPVPEPDDPGPFGHRNGPLRGPRWDAVRSGNLPADACRVELPGVEAADEVLPADLPAPAEVRSHVAALAVEHAEPPVVGPEQRVLPAHVRHRDHFAALQVAAEAGEVPAGRHGFLSVAGGGAEAVVKFAVVGARATAPTSHAVISSSFTGRTGAEAVGGGVQS
jgi:hypothetical protein